MSVLLTWHLYGVPVVLSLSVKLYYAFFCILEYSFNILLCNPVIFFTRGVFMCHWYLWCCSECKLESAESSHVWHHDCSSLFTICGSILWMTFQFSSTVLLYGCLQLHPVFIVNVDSYVYRSRVKSSAGVFNIYVRPFNLQFV